MNQIDWLELDAKLLRLLVTVVDTGSVTRAALHLGVTQSAVSHLLEKLRGITGDALFVKSGRGIVPTARALSLTERARDLLGQLERFAQSESFNPALWQTTLTIAANDFQRDALLPELMHQLSTLAPGVRLRVIPSDVPTPEMLRQEQAQLVISPRPPEGVDLVQKRLFSDHYRVFYDPTQRSAPKTRKAYLDSEHVSVLYVPQRPLDLDQQFQKHGIERVFRVLVPGFAGVPAFIRGTHRLATVPGLLQHHLMAGLAHAPVPLPCPRMPMYMIWHLRHHRDPAHRWLRSRLEVVAARFHQRH